MIHCQEVTCKNKICEKKDWPSPSLSMDSTSLEVQLIRSRVQLRCLSYFNCREMVEQAFFSHLPEKNFPYHAISTSIPRELLTAKYGLYKLSDGARSDSYGTKIPGSSMMSIHVPATSISPRLQLSSPWL